MPFIKPGSLKFNLLFIFRQLIQLPYRWKCFTKFYLWHKNFENSVFQNSLSELIVVINLKYTLYIIVNEPVGEIFSYSHPTWNVDKIDTKLDIWLDKIPTIKAAKCHLITMIWYRQIWW